MLGIGFGEPEHQTCSTEAGEVFLQQAFPDFSASHSLQLLLAAELVTAAFVIDLLDDGIVGIVGFFKEQAQITVVFGDVAHFLIDDLVLMRQVTLEEIEECFK